MDSVVEKQAELEIKPEPGKAEAKATVKAEVKAKLPVYEPGKVVDNLMIRLTPEVLLDLETIGAQTRGLEFSGFGYVQPADDGLLVDKIVLLHVGSETFTEISTKRILELNEGPDASRMKLWFHRHPLGNGIPGPHNWSGTDNTTIRTTPLGGVPALVEWSASIVRTPDGWAGRIDRYDREKDYTFHVGVSPNIKKDLAIEARQLMSVGRTWQGWGGYSFTGGLQPTGLAGRLADLEMLSDDQWENLMDVAVGSTDLFVPSPTDFKQHALVGVKSAVSTKEWINDTLNVVYNDLWDDGKYDACLALEVAQNGLWEHEEELVKVLVEEVIGAGSYTSLGDL